MLLSLIETWDTHIRTWAGGLGWPIEGLLRLLLAAVAGGLVGLEREVRGRQAGFRTNMLVCLGSALVMIVSIHFASVSWQHDPGINVNVDPARIAYGVMTGVGFLGAGTILHHRGAVRGLTTAAGLWCVAAIGLSVGFGMYVLSAMATVLVVLALWFLDYFEDFLPKQKSRSLVIRTAYEPGAAKALVDTFKSEGIRVMGTTFQRSDDLTKVDVRLDVVFYRPEQFARLEQEIERDRRYELIAVQEV